MAIVFNEEKRTFSLHTAKTTYQLKIGNLNYVKHLYYGTTIEDVLRFVGVNKLPRYVILGDTMTGITVTDIKTPVTAGMRAITVMHSLRPMQKSSCTRCGKCVTVCPMGLPVYLAMRYHERGDDETAALFGAERCTGCGACSAVCPSGLEASDIMRSLKKKQTLV